MICRLPAIIPKHYTQLLACVYQNIVDQPGRADFNGYGGEDFAGDCLDIFEHFGIDNADVFDLTRWNLLQYFLHFDNNLLRFCSAGLNHPAACLK